MWKEIKENNNYIINKNGEIISKKTNKKLKPAKTKNGYMTVALCSNGKQKTYYVHRLVANNFIDNPHKHKEINHKDGNKLNNNVDNLEWCTRSHNLKEAYKLGLKYTPKSKDNVNSKRILEYNMSTGQIKVWDSLSDVKREKGYSTGALCYALNHFTDYFKGSHWEYYEEN